MKEKIKDLEDFELHYNSQILEDKKTLKDYGIKNFATIRLKKVKKGDLHEKPTKRDTFIEGFKNLEELQDHFLTQKSQEFYWDSTRKLKMDANLISGFITSFDNKYYIVSYKDTTIEIYFLKSGKLYRKFECIKDENGKEIRDSLLALTKDNKCLYAAMPNGKIYQYNIESGEQPTSFPSSIGGKKLSFFP